MARTKTGHGKNECGTYKCKGDKCGGKSPALNDKDKLKKRIDACWKNYHQNRDKIYRSFGCPGWNPDPNSNYSKFEKLEEKYWAEFKLEMERLKFDYFLNTGTVYEEEQEIED